VNAQRNTSTAGPGRRVCAAGVLALALCTTPGAEAARRLGSLSFEPCTLAAVGLPTTVAAQCASLDVPEDRANPEGRQISLALAWVPGRARQTRPDPVFMLAGGPGQAAREAFPAVQGAFREVLRERDVILVDQRGTGGSNPLACRDDRGASTITEDVAGQDLDAARRFASECLAELDADPRHYTTTEAVRDLDDVRRAIGAGQVNLVGISYGTRVAQEYLRRFPAETRTLVLDGVVPPSLALGSEHARNLDAALKLQFRRCEAEPGCARRFGSPWASLQRLLEELRAGHRSVTFNDPLSFEVRDGELTPGVVAGVVRLYSYSPQLAALLPMALAEALAGRPQALMAQARMIEDLVGEQIMHGMQLSVSCSEDADLLEPDPQDQATLLGNYFVEFVKAQCEVWPRGAVPRDFHEPVASDHPVLLLSGEFDPVTPPRYGEEVLSSFPRGRHLVLRGAGHNVIGTGCAPKLLARFIERADTGGLDAGCLEQLIYTPPFVGAYGWEP
jgi:pimeloyl-ACP methyl ester carboxylesterase